MKVVAEILASVVLAAIVELRIGRWLRRRRAAERVIRIEDWRRR